MGNRGIICVAPFVKGERLMRHEMKELAEMPQLDVAANLPGTGPDCAP